MHNDKTFIACNKFDLDLVFIDTMIIDNFHIFETLDEARTVIFGFGRFVS